MENDQKPVSYKIICSDNFSYKFPLAALTVKRLPGIRPIIIKRVSIIDVTLFAFCFLQNFIINFLPLYILCCLRL